MRLNRTGFTLLEIMIVVAVIGLLAGIAIPNFITARQDAIAGVCGANVRLIQDFLEMANIETDISIQNLNSADLQNIIVPNYVRTMPICPTGGAYSTDNDGIVGCSIHSSGGGDGGGPSPYGEP